MFDYICISNPSSSSNPTRMRSWTRATSRGWPCSATGTGGRTWPGTCTCASVDARMAFARQVRRRAPPVDVRTAGCGVVLERVVGSELLGEDLFGRHLQGAGHHVRGGATGSHGPDRPRSGRLHRTSLSTPGGRLPADGPWDGHTGLVGLPAAGPQQLGQAPEGTLELELQDHPQVLDQRSLQLRVGGLLVVDVADVVAGGPAGTGHLNGQGTDHPVVGTPDEVQAVLRRGALGHHL
jgi:hypothetical protein